MEISEKVRQVVGDIPPITPKEFLTKLWSLRQYGNVEDAYIQACYAIKTKKTFTGQPVTLDLLVEKYQQYLDQCKANETGQKFIKGITNFIRDNGFNMEFGATGNESVGKWTS